MKGLSHVFKILVMVGLLGPLALVVIGLLVIASLAETAPIKVWRLGRFSRPTRPHDNRHQAVKPNVQLERRTYRVIKKIISGGQTGTDRGALDAALHCGIEHGGSIPKGRKAENGVVSPMYRLEELSTASYPARTEKNILDSDGTLILSHGRLTGGSALTRGLAEKHKKPVLHIDFSKRSQFDAVSMVKKWIERNNIEVLNVAGPRASKDPLIYRETVELLCGIMGAYPPPSDLPGFFITEPMLAYAA